MLEQTPFQDRPTAHPTAHYQEASQPRERHYWPCPQDPVLLLILQPDPPSEHLYWHQWDVKLEILLEMGCGVEINLKSAKKVMNHSNI